MAFRSEEDDDVRAAPSPAVIAHGGDLGAARRAFPGAPEPWLDLSTGINPVPYPLPPFEASALTRLPAPDDLARLKAVAAHRYGAPGPDHVVAAPGTQVLISLLPHLRPRARVAVLGPTYAEHAAAWAAAGHDVGTVGALDDALDADTVVLVSPNNPDGRVLGRHALRALADRLAQRGGLLVLDEAFADLEAVDAPPEPADPRSSHPCPHPEVPKRSEGFEEDLQKPLGSLEVSFEAADAAPQDEEASGIGDTGGSGVLRLRSFGKSYGLAGLRLGFALGDPALVRRIESALGPWAVSGPALVAGLAALPDETWLRQASEARAQDAARLDRMIGRAGGRIVGGTVLFRTAAFDDAPALFARLGEAGIHVRRFAERPTWLRFGLPPDKEAWCRLSRVLK